MGYWRNAFIFAWRKTKWFTRIRACIPPILAALYVAWHKGEMPINRWIEASLVLLGTYVALTVVEFLYKLVIKAPATLYSGVAAEAERLNREVEELLEPKLEILFELQYPYDDQRTPAPTEKAVPYRLFRVGVRNVGIRTVDDIKVVISDIDPRPKGLFSPLPLQAMHDRSDRKTTELHPSDEPWYFDVVEQGPNGQIRIVHVVPGSGCEMSPQKYTVKIRAEGHNVPSVSRWFIISVPTPRQGNQDLQFRPADQPPHPAINSPVNVQT